MDRGARCNIVLATTGLAKYVEMQVDVDVLEPAGDKSGSQAGRDDKR